MTSSDNIAKRRRLIHIMADCPCIQCGHFETLCGAEVKEDLATMEEDEATCKKCIRIARPR